MISISENKRVFYIGANGSGKTHSLKKHQRNNKPNSLFFDEAGVCNTLVDKSKVLIQDNYYIYSFEGERGKRQKDSNEKVEIKKNLLVPIKKIRSVLDKLRSFKPSPGIKKLKLITEELLTRNLNSINTIIIDEPENFLDDENLKVLSEILLVFYELNISLFFATHSSRFLELNMAKPDEIILLKEFKKINIEYCDIKRMFEDVSKEILDDKSIFCEGKRDPGMEGKMKLKGKPLDIFLKSFLYSHEYYRCLFYDEVTLAEGLTEKILIASIQSSKISNKNFYFTSGKIFIPFYINLFRMYHLYVKAIFDSDKSESKIKSSSSLTDYLVREYGNNSKVRLVISQGVDLEEDYGIRGENTEKFKIECGFNRKQINNKFFKPYIALYGLTEDHLEDKFIKSLNYQERNTNYELM